MSFNSTGLEIHILYKLNEQPVVEIKKSILRGNRKPLVINQLSDINDEWCDTFICSNCNYKGIKRDYNFCPRCGKSIVVTG